MIGEVTREFTSLIRKEQDCLNKRVVGFYRDLKKAAPVRKGNFRDSWEMTRTGKMNWVIYNPASYGLILWRGRRQGVSKLGNPKMYGSEQWKEGGEPMLARFKEDLNRECL